MKGCSRCNRVPERSLPDFRLIIRDKAGSPLLHLRVGTAGDLPGSMEDTMKMSHAAGGTAKAIMADTLLPVAAPAVVRAEGVSVNALSAADYVRRLKTSSRAASASYRVRFFSARGASIKINRLVI